MAINKTLYIRDEDVSTWEKATTLVGDGSLSQFLSNYLREYVASREASQGGKERIVVRFIDNEIPHAQAFYGRWLIRIGDACGGTPLKIIDGKFEYYATAITAKNKIAIFKFLELLPSHSDQEKFLPGKLHVFDSLDQALKAGIPPGVIAAIKTKMGVEVEELDI